MKKSEIEILYEEYLKRDDMIIKIDTFEYYRIIEKDHLSVNNGIVLVTIPWDIFKGSKLPCKVVDENGRIFELGKPVHYSFVGRHIPDWYMECAIVPVNNEKNPDLIGEYFAIYNSERIG